MNDPAVVLMFFSLALLAFCAVGAYSEWRERVRYRKLERLVHRNLERQAGR